MNAFMNKLLLYILLTLSVIIGLMHLPFLKSDPEKVITEEGSRDANTDEGLNSCQIRNFVNQGNITMDKSDNFVKTPLFGGILYAPFKIFGTKLWMGRLTVLLISLGICFYIFSRNKYFGTWGIFSFFIVFTQLYIFSYFHYCMAEILATAFIFLSLYLMIHPYKSNAILKSSLLPAIMVSFAYYIKLQFAYAVFIIPLSLLLFILFNLNNRKILIQQFLYTNVFIIAFALIYFLFWYLPNKSFFDYVMSNQIGDRFEGFSKMFNRFELNLEYAFYVKRLIIYTYSYYILFFIGLVWCFFTKNKLYKIMFIVLSCWVLLESHKLFLTYFPTRYAISLLFAMGMSMALIIHKLFSNAIKNKFSLIFKVLSISITVFLAIINFSHYYSTYKNRTFELNKINKYLSSYPFKENPILGTWATSVSWESKAISYPIWNNYFNYQDIIKQHKPCVIVIEVDEKDSDQSFKSSGVNVDDYADSIKYFEVNYWKLKLLWIKPEYYK